MTTSTTYDIFVSVAMNEPDDWDKINEVVNEVCERHPEIEWMGSGTGFGRRDHDFQASNFAEVGAFVHDLRTVLDLNGLSDVEVSIPT